MIRIQGLRKSFGTVAAVAGLDLAVERGRLLVLLGPNGAGKSTTLRCAGGILHPDAGEVRFDHLRLPQSLDQVRLSLGVVPDQARLYGRCTAREYLDHFGRLYGVPEPERGRRISELLERFGLAARDELSLATYSRGMAQKVALIRATLHQPAWIFCDEPTGGLDPVAAAEMRSYLDEQRRRGAALVVTTHILGEAELMADEIAIMRHGRIVAAGTFEQLRARAAPGRAFTAHLSATPVPAERLLAWLRRRVPVVRLEGERLEYELPADWATSDVASFAAELQRRLAALGAPYYRLEERAGSLEAVYVGVMAESADQVPEAVSEPVPAPSEAAQPGLRASTMIRSLAEQPGRLSHLLPFYLGSWWRRGDLSWVLYLNAFVLLLVAGASLFGTLPGRLGVTAATLGGRQSLAAALLLPLFFMSFALLESIKTSIGIWWEKAQQSLEVLLYTPMDDASLIWMEVLPGALISTAWVALWMSAGLLLLGLFGQDAPWNLLPVFALVALVTAYWAAMGRMLGFLLFPREGAAGGAWSFLLSPVSAAVADLPLALFVLRSPYAPWSLLVPLGACLALTLITASGFDREKLLDSGVERGRRRGRSGLGWVAVRRSLGGLALGICIAALMAGLGLSLSWAHHLHSWPQAWQLLAGTGSVAPTPDGAGAGAVAPAGPNQASGVTLAAALLAGVSAALVLALSLLALSFAAFFLLGVPELLGLLALSALWGVQLGFGRSAPLAGWLSLGGGLVVLAAALNAGASLPVYRALLSATGGRVERLRQAWRDYLAIYRSLVLACCLAFGLLVALLLILG